MARHRKTKTLWMFAAIYSVLIGTSVPVFSESEDSSDLIAVTGVDPDRAR